MSKSLVDQPTPENDLVEIYTDGACKGNPGPGGWAALLKFQGKEKLLSGAERHTTNNRMELTAAIMSFEALKRPCKVRIFTDSQYVKKGISEWLANWRRRGWRTSGSGEVKNKDLWVRLDNAASRHEVDWRWVRGHSNHPENERVDQEAGAAIRRMFGRE